MREYKMGRGEYLDERVEDMKAFVEEHFGTVTGTETHGGSDLFVVEDPDNPVFDRVTAGTVSYDSKKDTVALDIEERPAAEVIEAGHADAAQDAVSVKNDFLEGATGRDAESRRKSLKRQVEDSDAPDSVS